jgi:hypothetical protein
MAFIMPKLRRRKPLAREISLVLTLKLILLLALWLAFFRVPADRSPAGVGQALFGPAAGGSLSDNVPRHPGASR